MIKVIMTSNIRSEKIRKRLEIVLKVLFIVSFCGLFFIQCVYTHNQVKNWYNLNKAKELLRTLSWIEQHSDSEDVILTTWTLGYQVVTYTNRKVVATSKVYPSAMKTVAERYRDISRFFFSQSEKDAMEIIHKYNIRYILIPRRFDVWICRYIGTCNLVANNRKSLNDEGRSRTIIGQMLDEKTFKNFILVNKSRRFIIYKLIEHI